MKVNKNKLLMKIISVIVILVVITTTCIFQMINLRKAQAKENTPKASQVGVENNLSNFDKKLDADKYTKEIYSEQFKSDDRKNAKLLVANLINELKQIVMQRSKDDLALYDEYVLLRNEMEENKAVYLLLKLKDKFSSYEAIMDEYLLSIQLDIDLEKYLTSEDNYKKEKDENINKIKNGEIITLSKIEQIYLENVQQKNNYTNNKEKNTEEKINNNEPNVDINKKSNNGSNNNVNDANVQHPTDNVMKEIDDINNRSINIEGR